MHPKNLTPALLSQYGTPLVRRVFGLSSVYYNPGQFPGWAIARSLAQGNFLTDRGRAALLSLQPSKPEEWAKVAEVEGIPTRGFTAPFALDQLQKLPQRAKLTEVTFDQDTFNTLFACLRLHATNAAATRTATYPLLDGPPGASKSLIANICAALLQLPVVTVTGSDGSADELKIELFGGDNASSKDIAGIVKDYLYQGWIFHPLSRKLAALEQQTHATLDSFSTDTLLEIAQHERIKENITAFMPGKYQLAAMHGYLLFLDETNGFKGVTTLLTQMLENYTTDLHPTFFLMGAMNPAGEKHNREPLPPEIRSRFNTVPVLPPSDNSYFQMLTYAFSGEQPIIHLPNGKKGRVTPAMLGITIPPREAGILKHCLTGSAFNTLLSNLAKFHKAVELKLEEGVLDPKNGTSGTQETLSVDRRTLTKCISALETFIALRQEGAAEMAGDVMRWDAYERMGLAAINQDLVISAITEAFELFYVTPFNFPISEEIELTKGTKKEFVSAAEVVRCLLDMHSLSPDKLRQYIKTTEDLDKLRACWAERFAASPLFDPAQSNTVVQQAIDEEMKLDDKHAYFIRNKVTHQVSLCSLRYLNTVESRKTFLKENYPQFVLKGDTKVPVQQILDSRLGAVACNNKRFIAQEEIAHVKDPLRKLCSKFTDSHLFVPLLDPVSQGLSMIVFFPLCVLPEEQRAHALAKDPGATHTPVMAILRQGKVVQTGDSLHALARSMLKARHLVGPTDEPNFDAIKEDVMVELTVRI